MAYESDTDLLAAGCVWSGEHIDPSESLMDGHIQGEIPFERYTELRASAVINYIKTRLHDENPGDSLNADSTIENWRRQAVSIKFIS